MTSARQHMTTYDMTLGSLGSPLRDETPSLQFIEECRVGSTEQNSLSPEKSNLYRVALFFTRSGLVKPATYDNSSHVTNLIKTGKAERLSLLLRRYWQYIEYDRAYSACYPFFDLKIRRYLLSSRGEIRFK